MDQQQRQRDEWAASPIPPLWGPDQVKRGVPSVDPAAHSRVRALPQTHNFAGNNQDHERIGERERYDKQEEADDGDGGSNQEDDVRPELKALPLFSLVTPQPRRVVSPELIFSSAAESLSRCKRLRFSAPNASQDEDNAQGFLPTAFTRAGYHFRSIVADRPDVEEEVTSPPMRSNNPVVMDSRFQLGRTTRFDLQKDARAAPVQPFYPRATRRFPPSSS